MPKTGRPILTTLALLSVLTAGGCASHSSQDAKPPMTQAQAQQKLGEIAADPNMPDTARAAAQQGVDEAQAKQMMEQGR